MTRAALPGKLAALDDDDRDDYECIDDAYCLDCGGDGWVNGEDIAGYYDYGWIDRDRVYKCSNCRGSGLRKDMTYW